MNCEKCGTPMVEFEQEFSIGATCPNCGWGFSTTKSDPILSDRTIYDISLLPGNAADRQILGAVSKVAGIGYVEAKKRIDGPHSKIFSGKASEVLSKKKTLDAAGVRYTITPDFPHE
ncbi:MAG: hypothetical protein ACOYIK_09725 [Coriobacteriales bacterium]|jgi:hypothetical protein